MRSKTMSCRSMLALLALLLGTLSEHVDGNREVVLAADDSLPPCPSICSTSEIYGVAALGGLCRCNTTLSDGVDYLRGEGNCWCYLCFLQQQDGKVVGYEHDSSGCRKGAVDCSKCTTSLAAVSSGSSGSSSRDSTSSSMSARSSESAPASSTPPPPAASATGSSTSSTSKSSGWSGISISAFTFLCVLALGLAVIAATKLNRKKTQPRVDRDCGDVYYRTPGFNGDSMSFEARAVAVAPASIAVHSHVIGEVPDQTYEVLVIGVDASNEHQQQPQRQQSTVEAAPVTTTRTPLQSDNWQ